MSKIQAPWTDEQVAALQAWQRCDWVHEFTCPQRADHILDGRGNGELTATKDGWLCAHCGYTQTWVHEFMTGPLPVNPFEAFKEWSEANNKERPK